jgi:hypothetical protein
MTEAAIAEVSVTDNNDGGDVNEERSLSSDAWRAMRRNPLFWVSAGLITIFVLMAIWPSLFTSTDPTNAILAKSRERPNADGLRHLRQVRLRRPRVHPGRRHVHRRHGAHRRRHRCDVGLPGRLGRLADVAHR